MANAWVTWYSEIADGTQDPAQAYTPAVTVTLTAIARPVRTAAGR